MLAHTARLLPHGALGHLGWLRGAVGAGLGIGVTAIATALLLRYFAPGLPMILAPMGASAVLLFGLPASPLAQPWPVIGGNVVAALAGLVAGMALDTPLPAAVVAVALAIAAMSVLRCLHPPGGGTALLYALGATGAEHWDWLYLVPVLVNGLALACAGWLYNNLTGHQWPHRLVVPVAPALPSEPAPITREDVVRVLDEWNEVLDVGPEDLLAFVQAVDRQRGKNP
ncbi:MAG: HPP family protein [Pseudomonadota bacterium]